MQSEVKNLRPKCDIIDLLKVVKTIENTEATNQILEINELILDARERNRRDVVHSWSGSIKYLLWNATGLKKNLDRIIDRMIKDNIILGFIVETWLNPERALPAECKETSAVCNVHPVGYDRGKNGVSILINPKMKKHPAMKELQILSRDTLNGTYILAEICNLKILCVYHSPTNPVEIDTWLEEIIEKCNGNLSDDFILLGDFNARCRTWRDHSSNSKGHCLRRWIEANSLKRVDTGSRPTYMTKKGNSIVDHVFSSDSVEISGSVVPPFVNVAGHRPIVGSFTVSSTGKTAYPTYTRIKLENLKTDDYRDKYAARLTTSISFFRSRIDNFMKSGAHLQLEKNFHQGLIDEFDKYFVECIIRLAKEILGVKKCGKTDIPYEPLMSEELLILEAAMASETDFDRNEILLAKATKELERLRTERFQLFAEEMSSKSATEIMKISSAMLTNRKKQKMALSSSDESLDIYRSHFAKMNTNSLPSHVGTVEPVKYQSAQLPAYELMKDFISPSSLGFTLKWIAWNKSAGSTDLSYDLLKVAPFQVL